ncbi:MAG: caspase family protein [Burkholderiaceae bacterium]|nr:caspase family protein [Sulfuritalea sp.]MCF8173862.1 caspase family protein [Burkholderiaceae bacterium]
MTSRRTFIKTLAALPPVLSFRRSWAAGDPSRVALIIGNGSYPDAPLINPVNDARAVGQLFTQAGFSVDSRLDANRVDMMAAIERFSAAAKRSETKLVVFYYAGHGAQLDWRNYLLPVDAQVTKQEHIKQRCVDLGVLLGQLSAAKDKTFIVILDACRNNPFGAAYRPERQGLSQFDAPVGSLLAYATAPGSVASDGEGDNGLYTGNLVRELNNRGTRIEDALKRVRLNVRLASQGQQIPWETTSLESEVFIFDSGRKKLSESELEKLVEADVTEWTRIKSSRKLDDWVSYLRNFPNGRFAEIAQMRLNRLLAETEKTTSAPGPANPAAAQAAKAPQAPAQAQGPDLKQLEAEKAAKLAAEKRLEQERLMEQKRLEQERAELERIRLAEEQRLAAERERIRLADEQRLAAERKQLEEQQRLELRRIEDEKERERVRRKQEQERIENERVERERLALERKREEEQRLLAEQKRIEQQQLERAERDRAEKQRLAAEQKRLEDERRLTQEQSALAEQKLALAKQEAATSTKLDPARPPSATQEAAVAKSPAAGVALDIRAGVPMPMLIAPSANPFSAGSFPLGRIFTVGDRAVARYSDMMTGIEEDTRNARVTRIDLDEDRVEFNQGKMITDLMGNPIKQGQAEYETPVQWTPAVLQVGRKWTAAFRLSKDGESSNAYYDLQITRRETISVPAGNFDTFRIEGTGWNTTFGSSFELVQWVVPGVNFTVKREFTIRSNNRRIRKAERMELVALRQQVFVAAA